MRTKQSSEVVPAGTLTLSVKSLTYQDASNSVYGCGEFDDALGRYVFYTDTITSPNGMFLEAESPIQIGNITSGVVNSDDGSCEDCTRIVQSTEAVSTPIGLYEAYKISESCSFSSGSVLVNTIWQVPDLFTIKESGTADGLALDLLITSFNLN